MQESLYMAMEIGIKSWNLNFSRGGRKRRYITLHHDEFDCIGDRVAQMKKQFGLEPQAPVLSCYEAGLQGFWIHRLLEQIGIQNLVVDSASIEVNRRRRRAKTDRIDASKLMNMLLRHHGGENGMWAVVNVPEPLVEDRRRLHREHNRLRKELTQHNNRIKGLLCLHGPIFVTINVSFRSRLKKLDLPTHAREEIERQYARWELVKQHMAQVESQMAALVKEPDTPSTQKAAKLKRLRSIGTKIGWVLSHEMYGWRNFKNRKQVGGFVGLCSVPYDSGESTRGQGISKAGNKPCRCLANQLAWLWIRHQPQSELTLWFKRKCASGSKRQRRVAITALSRKLLVALWRWVDQDILPKGALLKF